jgi:hypothetical protein
MDKTGQGLSLRVRVDSLLYLIPRIKQDTLNDVLADYTSSKKARYRIGNGLLSSKCNDFYIR